MASKKEEKEVFVPKSAAELQKIRLNKLMSNPEKPVVIPDRPEEKLPRVFNPPEFVRNIWGSSAGAGSGDFHVYRGVRRREYARQKYLEQEQKKNDLDAAHKAKVEINRKVAEERTAKKRAKRQRKKTKQKMKKFKTSQSKDQDKKKENSSEDEESDQDDDEETLESNGTTATESASKIDSRNQRNDNEDLVHNTNSQNTVDENSEDSDEEEDSARQREQERRAMLASQPEDVDDNSCSEDETES